MKCKLIRFLSTIILLLISSSCWANYAFVRGTTNFQTNTTCTITFATASANDLYVIGAQIRNTTETITSITISGGNTNATQYVGLVGFNGTISGAIYYAIPTLSSNYTFVVNFSANSTHSCVVLEFSGNPSSGITDQSASGTGTSATWNASSSITPTQANSLVVALEASLDGTPSAGTNYTMGASQPSASIGMEYWIQTTPTATNGPMTGGSSADFVDIVADFNITPSAGVSGVGSGFGGNSGIGGTGGIGD